MPSRRPRGTFSVGRAAFWSFTWSLGVALGVALGGWLTVASGSGAPGTASLDVVHDLVVVPILSGLVVFLVLFGVRVVLGLFRGRSA